MNTVLSGPEGRAFISMAVGANNDRLPIDAPWDGRMEYLRNHSSQEGLDENNPDGQVLVKKCGASDDRLPE